MSITSGYWFLHSQSVLDHSYHLQLAEDSSKLTKEHLSPSHLDMVFELYNNSVPTGKIANIMTSLINKTGCSGEFVPATMRNITTELEDIMNDMAQVDHDFLVAGKTLAKLHA